MSEKLSIIIPYRNRKNHLDEFVPYMNDYLKSNIQNEFNIIIVEQANNNLFNRGSLINIGFDLEKNNCTYISPHDVDLLPEDGDYSLPTNPTHLAAYRSQKNYILEYDTFFGGVNLFLNDDFAKVNGFSNLYAGYGAEDDDLYLRCFMVLQKPIDRRYGRYRSLDHGYDYTPENLKSNQIYYHTLRTNNNYNNYLMDGLNTIKYNLIDKKEIKQLNYIHYFVDFENGTK
jgi:hypothetical protein